VNCCALDQDSFEVLNELRGDRQSFLDQLKQCIRLICSLVKGKVVTGLN